MRKIRAALALLLPALVSCSHDAYETGDSKYSYLRTDFVEARADGSMQLVSAVTDDNLELSFAKSVSASWVTTADSTYRALLYYNIGDGSGSPMTVEPVSIARVYVLRPKTADDWRRGSGHSSRTDSIATDPVHFQSAWTSANGKYVNLSLALMTGIADSIDNGQSIGLLSDSVVAGRNGSHTYYYKLLHSQGDVPQYYKSTVYVSIPIQEMTTGDAIRLSLNTYDGWITREYRKE